MRERATKSVETPPERRWLLIAVAFVTLAVVTLFGVSVGLLPLAPARS
jgi:hypothetical protein